MSLTQIAIGYIEVQFDEIVELVEFEPADQFTADHIEAMMEAMLAKLVKNNMIYDYQVKSSAIDNEKIYTSVIFNLKMGTNYTHINFESHQRKKNKTKAARDTAFDRAMKGI